jgi:LPS sulfotransferase NodH
MQFTYAKSLHEKVLEQAFGAALDVPAQERRYPCLILAFVNRSGSNYLAELLKSTGKFAGLGECLNDHNVKYLAPRYGVTTFADYLIRHRREDLRLGHNANDEEKIWGLKAGWMQLAMLCRTRAIPNLLDPSIVLIRRRDAIGQAISYYIAEKTAQWTSKEASTIARQNIAYDGEQILLFFKSIMDSYSKLEQVSVLSGYPLHEIAYEDLIENPGAVVSAITKDITGHELTVVPSKVTINVQRDAMNDSFRSRFSDELKRLQWDAQ